MGKGFICAIIILFFLCFIIAGVLREDGSKKTVREKEADQLLEQRDDGKKQRKASKMIRVLIRNSDYQGLYHECLEMSGDAVLLLDDGKGEQSIPAGEEICLRMGDEVLKGGKSTVIIAPKAGNGRISVMNLRRSQGTPSYSGRMEVRETEKGLLLINVIPLEEYLRGVLPSEMPASFPEEALKAQAICARTYAYKMTLQPGYSELGADLDDSTAFQVYGNLEEQVSCTEAVKATSGLVLVRADGSVMDTFYYSTSCGRGTNASAWQSEEGIKPEDLVGKRISRSAMREMLPDTNDGKQKKTGEAEMGNSSDEIDFLLVEDPDDYESKMPWYRWSYKVERIDHEEMAKRIQRVLGLTEMVAFHSVSSMQVTRRRAGGIAWELRIITDQDGYVIRGEHAIREVLCDGRAMAIQKDGTAVSCPAILPSAFFLIETSAMGENVIGYSLNGGGLGHGIGMSQNAAGIMAEEGHCAEEILAFFYEGGELYNME